MMVAQFSSFQCPRSEILQPSHWQRPGARWRCRCGSGHAPGRLVAACTRHAIGANTLAQGPLDLGVREVKGKLTIYNPSGLIRWPKKWEHTGYGPNWIWLGDLGAHQLGSANDCLLKLSPWSPGLRAPQLSFFPQPEARQVLCIFCIRLKCIEKIKLNACTCMHCIWSVYIISYHIRLL